MLFPDLLAMIYPKILHTMYHIITCVANNEIYRAFHYMTIAYSLDSNSGDFYLQNTYLTDMYCFGYVRASLDPGLAPGQSQRDKFNLHLSDTLQKHLNNCTNLLDFLTTYHLSLEMQRLSYRLHCNYISVIVLKAEAPFFWPARPFLSTKRQELPFHPWS